MIKGEKIRRGPRPRTRQEAGRRQLRLLCTLWRRDLPSDARFFFSAREIGIEEDWLDLPTDPLTTRRDAFPHIRHGPCDVTNYSALSLDCGGRFTRDAVRRREILAGNVKGQTFAVRRPRVAVNDFVLLGGKMQR